ncbi:hypothetical protein CYMTET_6874 [Cymbomonas tetramitiformis]|uniref:Uncharacterized protein n=1 Tax=Cymbomonas tetramitiformis TaxID=36881 RepID=A0AAE0GW60_9CHLO|nr:hypothetical protein CYMTET_6874 [Cymbomonas tetramitiformis]
METIIKKDPKDLDTPIILDHHAILDREPKTAVEDGLRQSLDPKAFFRQRYDTFTGGILEALKDHNGVCYAGGSSLLKCLMEAPCDERVSSVQNCRGGDFPPEQHDVDIVILCSSLSEARALLDTIVEKIMAKRFPSGQSSCLADADSEYPDLLPRLSFEKRANLVAMLSDHVGGASAF